MERVKVASLADLNGSHQHLVEAFGTEVLLIKEGDRIYALENVCSHMELPLEGGRVILGTFRCPHHGARFDLETGAAKSMPAVTGVKSFRVEIVEDDIFLSRG